LEIDQCESYPGAAAKARGHSLLPIFGAEDEPV
jgi:hypothetical protein